MAKKVTDGKKELVSCLLCENLSKCRRYTCYSGIMKGGTTHKMLSCTVTFFERWRDITMHEIHVCRECQLRLWRGKQFGPMVLYASGAAVAAVTALVCLVLGFLDVLDWTVGIVLTCLCVAGALTLGGFFVYYMMQYQTKKPPSDVVEPLVIAEAAELLPYDNHTFLTTEQYIERHQKGIIG